jgi:Flp pilus assembly protein protease CpaA
MADWTQWCRFGLIVLVVAIAAVTDWERGRIYNWLTYPAFLLGFVLAVAFGYWPAASGEVGGWSGALTGLAHAAVGFGVAFIPLLALFLIGLFNGGDAKLLGAVGALSADWRFVLWTMLYMFLLGMLMAVFLMVRGRIVKRTVARVVTAAVATAVTGSAPPMPEDSPRVPYAVAMLAGVLLAGWEFLLGQKLPWSSWGL